MASISIRRLEVITKITLQVRAAMHGRSTELEAREILRNALNQGDERTIDLGEVIRRRFARFGGVELKRPPREPIRDLGIR